MDLKGEFCESGSDQLLQKKPHSGRPEKISNHAMNILKQTLVNSFNHSKEGEGR